MRNSEIHDEADLLAFLTILTIVMTIEVSSIKLVFVVTINISDSIFLCGNNLYFQLDLLVC